jgi:general secretion pathway protein A
MRRVEDDPKPSLTKDPSFLASLPPPPTPGAQAPRPLHELFPPSATEPAAPFDVPIPTTPTAAPAPARRASERPTTYQTFYGLTEPPFGLAASDLKFLYQSTEYDRVAQAMLGAIARHDGIVVLTGPVGIGKTMLCRAVIDQLDSRTLISFVDQPFNSIEQLLKKLLVDFGVVSRSEATTGRFRSANQAHLSTALRAFFASLVRLQASAVVIIDEAQNVRKEILQQLRLLVEAEGDARVLQVVLVGQPPLLRVLARRDLRALAQRVAMQCALGPLGAEEIGEYIAHRLRAAGGNARVQFDEAALRRLYELSVGNPLAVNLLCERALLLGFNTSSGVIDQPLVDAAAEELGLAPKASARRLVAVMILLGLLAVIGAASAALIFRDDVEAVMQKWQRQTSAPRKPN